MLRFFLTVLLFLELSAAFAIPVEAMVQAVPLNQDEPHRQIVKADQPLLLEFKVETGKSYLLEIDQGGLDLVVTIRTPDGSSASYDTPLFRDESELVLLDATATGITQVTLVSNEYTGAFGQVSARVEEIYPSTDAEREHLAAMRLISAASMSYHLGTEDGWTRALQAYQQAGSHLEKAGMDRDLARILYSSAYIEYWQLANWDRAIALAAQAAERYREVGHPRYAANALSLQAAALIEKATEVEKSESDEMAPEAKTLLNQALELFERALHAQQKAGFDYDAAKIINYTGLTYYMMGLWDEAVPRYLQAAATFRDANEWEAELDPLNNLAVIDFDQGNLVKAIEWFQRTLELIPPGKMSYYRADTLDNLGASQLALGQLDNALQSFSRALAIHEEIDNAKGQGRSLAGIGTTYYSFGEQELALEYLETALEARRKANDGRGQVSVLNFMGDIRRRNGDYEAAYAAHTQARQIAASLADQARTDLQISEDLVEMNRPDEALEILQKVSKQARNSGNRKLMAESMEAEGGARMIVGDFVQALAAYRGAAKDYSDLGLSAEEARAIFGMAKASRGTGQLELALEYANLALKSIESLRRELIAPELRAFFLATRQPYYEFLINLLMELHQISDTAEEVFLNNALTVSERSRSRALIDLISEVSVTFQETQPAGLAERQEKLYQLMSEARFRLNRLAERPGESETGHAEKVLAIKQELAEIENELNLLQIRQRSEDPAYASLTDVEILDAGGIQDMLGPNTALLQYALGESRSFVWLVTNESIQAWPLAPRESIEQAVRSVYDQLKAPAFSRQSRAELASALDSLTRDILEPVGLLDRERLIVVADGALQYLPFSVLNSRVPGKDSHPLLADHEIVHLPSMSVLAAQRKSQLGSPEPVMEIAIFADPVFSRGDKRLEARVVNGDAVVGLASPSTLTDRDAADLQRLPATSREARDIASLVQPSQRMLAIGFDANRESVVSSNLGDYRIIHFATHGLIDSRYPALSALAFSAFDERGNPRDGFVRLHDIYNLDLNADLVALSACSTALGREIAGEGLTGLTQGLMFSGSKTVLASLWQVPDRATAELMKRFYRNLMERNQKPAAALRNAQLDLSAVARWRSPYFWSAFVLQGDWL